MKAKHFSSLLRAGVGCGVLTALAGCSSSPSWGAWSKRPTDAEVAAVLARTAAQEQAAAEQAPATSNEPSTFIASR